jgi:superfamily II DNA or RNA helicase
VRRVTRSDEERGDGGEREPPGSLDALASWAASRGVGELLDRPLGELMPTYYGFRHPGVSTLDAAEPLRALFAPPPPGAPPSRVSEQRSLASFARRLLARAADDAARAATAAGVDRASEPAERWDALLAAVEAATPSADLAAPTARLAVRVLHASGQIIAQTVVQRQGERGRWSAGAVVPPDRLVAGGGVPLDELEEQIVAHLAEGSRYPWVTTPRRVRTMQLLGLLARHPRVHLATRPGVAVVIGKRTLRLALLEGPTGLVPELRVGPRPIAAGALLEALDERGSAVLVDEEEPSIVAVALDAAAVALVGALARHPVVVPAAAAGALLERLARAGSALEVELPPRFAVPEFPADPRPVVRLAPRSPAGVSLSLVSSAWNGAAGFPPGTGPARVSVVAAGGERAWAVRELEAERAAAGALGRKLGLEGEGPWAVETDEAALGLLEQVAAAAAEGAASAVAWPDEPAVEGDRPTLAAAGPLRVRVSRRLSWFAVEGELELEPWSTGDARDAAQAGGRGARLADLLDAAREGRRFVAVGKRRFLALTEELRGRLLAADAALHRRGERGEHRPPGLQASPLSAHVVASLVERPEHLEADASFIEEQARSARAAATDPPLPGGLCASLRPYQLEGFRWLMRLSARGAGGCLCDEMGLGKTLQARAVLLARAGEGPQLVVAPTSVGPNWVAEAARFAPSLRARLHRGSGRARRSAGLGPGDLVIASYDVLARDALDGGALAGVRFATLVLDEAQLAKNARSRRARAVRAVDAGLRLALTGTPVENHLGELWSIFLAVAPGLLGSWERFQERFAAPIERDGDVRRRAALAALIRPFLLRRTRAEVAPELPDRIELVRLVEPSPEERSLYDRTRREAASRVAAGGARAGGAARGAGRAAVLAELTRLRRLACHPRLLDPGSTVPSSKLDAFLALRGELREEGHRALVFSQFTSHLALVREALDRAGEAYLYLDGETPQDERARRVEAFQTGTVPLFLISLRAGGTGLNLTAADTVIHLDPWWNPATEEQASSRAFRIGQSRTVTIVRLIAVGTIEQAVMALQEEKRALAFSLFDAGAVGPSTDELAALLLAPA